MISYRPLKIYLLDHNLKLTNVIKECELSNSLVTKINQNKNIEIRALEKVCLYLDIPVESAVEFIKD